MQNPTERPAESLDSISPGLAVQERECQDAILRLHRLRKEASAEIERLIAFMDETDGYTIDEREIDDDAEPWLGWTARGASFGVDDREAEDENDEPSLASPEDMNGSRDQRSWARGCQDDREDEHDGAEPDDDAEQDRADDEPSLGWTIDGRICNSDGMDREHDGYSASRDVREARERGPSETPGVSVDGGRGYITQITGLTARQKEALGVQWVRR